MSRGLIEKLKSFIVSTAPFFFTGAQGRVIVAWVIREIGRPKRQISLNHFFVAMQHTPGQRATFS
jgi:hypothetical protein